jgi:hypothetical protein
MGGIFGMGGQQNTPPPPPPVPPAAIPSTFASPGVQQASANQARAAALAKGGGMTGTDSTSPRGDLVPPTTSKASLVG